MPVINIRVRRKRASNPVARIVCGNSDYKIAFHFDDEWDAYDTKTARFVYNGQIADVVFTGDVCDVPVITNATMCAVGVFAGDLHTTTPAMIACDKSILCSTGTPAQPTPDVYAQIMELLNNVGGSDEGDVLLDNVELAFARTTDASPVYTCEAVQIPLTPGAVYKITWDGVDYICRCRNASDFNGNGMNFNDTVYAGNWFDLFCGSGINAGTDTGEPFLILGLATGASVMTRQPEASHTVSVVRMKGLDVDYLPDNVPYSVSHKSAMTFAEPPVVSFAALGSTWWLVSELAPTTEELLATVFTINFSGNAIKWTPTAAEVLLDSEEFTGVMSAEHGGGFAIARQVGEITVNYGGEDVTVTIPSKGIYFAYDTGETVPEAFAIGVEYTELHKLDERLLPDGAGGLPDVTAEDEGKFLRVVGGEAVWTTVEQAEEVSF